MKDLKFVEIDEYEIKCICGHKVIVDAKNIKDINSEQTELLIIKESLCDECMDIFLNSYVKIRYGKTIKTISMHEYLSNFDYLAYIISKDENGKEYGYYNIIYLEDIDEFIFESVNYNEYKSSCDEILNGNKSLKLIKSKITDTIDVVIINNPDFCKD